MTAASSSWETVIGLEVHVELATKTKLFSGSLNEFGSEPNTNIDPVSLGLPGSLPVLNEKAVELAIRAGLALNCTIQRSVFARKNYFYPDMPKDFQTTQMDHPINIDGFVELPSGKRIGIERAHIEEDTGKSTHVGESGRISDAGHSLVDYNRAGVPLLEIVGMPELATSEEARQYVEELRAIVVTVGATDGKMEEGSLRVDANVSVRRPGEPLGKRCEIKNVNSMRSLGRAIDYEARRQIDLLESGEKIRQETRHWDEEGGRTRSGRSKEDADDYRYFVEPDLVPVDPDPAWVEEIRASLPALPQERRSKLIDASGCSREDAGLAVERDLDTLALGAIDAGAEGGRVMTHVTNNLAVDGAERLDVANFAELVRMETDGELSSTQTKTVLGEMVETGADPASIAASHGFEAMDTSELDTVLDQLIADNPDDWAELVGGNKKVMGFFTGQVMKATKGQADGKVVSQLLSARVSAAG